MESQNNRFNVAIRIKPHLEDDNSDLLTDEENRFVCAEKTVKLINLIKIFKV